MHATPTILVVDDETRMREITRDVLRLLGYQALLADDGLEGLHTLRRHADVIDAVQLDLEMPRMTGFEALVHLRGDYPYLPVILCSGCADPNIKDLVRADPFLYHLPKPFRIDGLQSMLRMALPRFAADFCPA